MVKKEDKAAQRLLDRKDRDNLRRFEEQLRELDDQELDELNQTFVEHYLLTFDPMKALRAAGFKEISSRVAGRLLTRKSIQQEIARRLSSNIMTREEVLWRLTVQGRNDYSEYIDSDGRVDLLRMMQDDKMHLIKGITPTRYGIKVEFMDGQRALEMLGKHYKLFTERIVHEGGVTVKVEFSEPLLEPSGEEETNIPVLPADDFIVGVE